MFIFKYEVFFSAAFLCIVAERGRKRQERKGPNLSDSYKSASNYVVQPFGGYRCTGSINYIWGDKQMLGRRLPTFIILVLSVCLAGARLVICRTPSAMPW